MKKVKNPAFRVLLPEHKGADPWFIIKKPAIKGVMGLGRDPFRVAPEDKQVRTHERASTCESLVDIYPDAISIGGPLGAGEDRGGVGFGGIIIMIPPLVMIYMIISDLEYFRHMWFFILPDILLFFCGIRLFKNGFFLPKDKPVIFDRKNRRVIFSQIKSHGFWELSKFPKFVAPVVVPWDSVRVRSFKMTQPMGKTLRDTYRLEVLAPDPSDEKKLLVGEAIGYLGWYEDEKLWQLYEHIRRYMEEDGPPIQHGEELRVKRMGRDLQPFPDEILASLGGPPLTSDEVKALAKTVPAQVFED